MNFDLHEKEFNDSDETIGILQRSLLSGLLALHRTGLNLNEVIMVKMKFDAFVATGISMIPMGRDLLSPEKREKLLPIYDKMFAQLEREYGNIKELLFDLRNGSVKNKD